jgi:hypothetical protein
MAMRARAAHARPPMRRPGGPMAMQRPPMGPEIVLGRIKAADKNKDGKLSKEEAPEVLKRHFERVDANKDGQLEPNELKRAGEAVRQHMRASFVKRHPDAAKRIQEARKRAFQAAKQMPEKPAVKKQTPKKSAAKKQKTKKLVDKKAKAKKPVDKNSKAKKPIDKKVEAKK